MRFIAAPCMSFRPASASQASCNARVVVLAAFVAVAHIAHPSRSAALQTVLPHTLRDGVLSPCEPARLSCIVSQHDEPPSFVEPFEYDPVTTGARQAQQAVLDAALRENGAQLLEQSAQYLSFRFEAARGAVDIAQFYFPVDDALVHFRAERVDGSFDYGSNRARLRRIGVRAHLSKLYVQRNRQRVFGLFESPFDRFGPSAVDVDAIIDNAPISARPIR